MFAALGEVRCHIEEVGKSDSRITLSRCKFDADV